MRPYEYAHDNYDRLLNERLEAPKKSIGLLCSFHDAHDSWRLSWNYSYNDLKKTVKSTCDELNMTFDVISEIEYSSDWAEKVMHLILANDFLVVDVTSPRPTVMYELGIACSFRDDASVLICKMQQAPMPSTEIGQLQMVSYDSADELKGFLRRHTAQDTSHEVEKNLRLLHYRLSPGEMEMLIRLLQARGKHVQDKAMNAWHASVSGDGEQSYFKLAAVKELQRLGLARFDYDYNADKNQSEWAFHATELGKRYLRSDYFLKRHFPPDRIDDIKEGLL